MKGFDVTHPFSHLSSNLEDYLEAISHLQHEKRVARAKDIADYLGVTRASVTSALKSLGEQGLINYEPYSFVTLTEAGDNIAREIIRRHEALKDFFENYLLLPSDHADANACRIEHAIDTEAMDRLVTFLDFVKNCPRCGSDWLGSFNAFCKDGVGNADCDQCLERCVTQYQESRKA